MTTETKRDSTMECKCQHPEPKVSMEEKKDIFDKIMSGKLKILTAVYCWSCERKYEDFDTSCICIDGDYFWVCWKCLSEPEKVKEIAQELKRIGVVETKYSLKKKLYKFFDADVKGATEWEEFWKKQGLREEKKVKKKKR